MELPVFDIPEYLAVLETPIGRVELTGDGSAVTSLSIEDEGSLPHDDLPRRTDRVLDDAALQLSEYFSGYRRSFDVALKPGGTTYQKAIWDGLGLVPYGSVVTYAELGYSAVGSRGGRAVGRAIAANPIPLLIPSHRVVSSRGRLTGYSGSNGLAVKRWLLDLEEAADV
ncbi:methylated-DNA--[protein]-cysteine S-methyltransferase [Paramicrobacterium sp. CJ85]|uniref:methylated-DNA--[protein]-cysteine S-methyltransferase n=1 Tax=Paramicrobacterium sp. CJ85 TaxID=3445355 RepID=UPI003F5F35ED